jgi:divalent metal cation (Fe/Co/Zn/Cd) transporter
MAYNVAEAVVALWAGAEAESIALVGFGLDSVIECAAAAVLLHHLLATRAGRDAEAAEASEHRAHRFIGFTFFALAAYVAFQAAGSLWLGEPPAPSLPGVVLAALSAVLMPLAAAWKLRLAREIGSAALRSEARETAACAWLSAALLLGLGANALAGWWWADPAVALAMVPWLAKEGLEGLRGEGCCEDGEARGEAVSPAPPVAGSPPGAPRAAPAPSGPRP